MSSSENDVRFYERRELRQLAIDYLTSVLEGVKVDQVSVSVVILNQYGQGARKLEVMFHANGPWEVDPSRVTEVSDLFPTTKLPTTPSSGAPPEYNYQTYPVPGPNGSQEEAGPQPGQGHGGPRGR